MWQSSSDLLLWGSERSCWGRNYDCHVDLLRHELEEIECHAERGSQMAEPLQHSIGLGTLDRPTGMHVGCKDESHSSGLETRAEEAVFSSPKQEVMHSHTDWENHSLDPLHAIGSLWDKVNVQTDSQSARLNGANTSSSPPVFDIRSRQAQPANTKSIPLFRRTACPGCKNKALVFSIPGNVPRCKACLAEIAPELMNKVVSTPLSSWTYNLLKGGKEFSGFKEPLTPNDTEKRLLSEKRARQMLTVLTAPRANKKIPLEDRIMALKVLHDSLDAVLAVKDSAESLGKRVQPHALEEEEDLEGFHPVRLEKYFSWAD